jgi:hypothetical protein
MSVLPLEIGLVHLFRPDRARIGHFLSSLQPIRLDIAGNTVIVRVTILGDCPDTICDHYGQLSVSEEALIFWTMDGLHHARSLAAVKASLTASNKEEVFDAEI